MKRVLRRRWFWALAVIVLMPLVVIGSYGFYLADSADMLPWQEDPTRIPITPFADIPGFNAPTAAASRPTQTPAPATATPTSEAVSRLDGRASLAGQEESIGVDLSISAVRAA
jgi:hypothetical protein